ncbi:MAG: hypothetical protein B6229_05025 [Spirochaetaceae bacterium 4572_7]|nr:MAG: hypothetical protein B6229_05025 [Spirochaetaceae bacterium 4572_7]
MIPGEWVEQFYIILVVFSLSSILFLNKLGDTKILLVFSFQFVCKYLFTKPFSNYVWFEFFLIVVMLLEGIYVLSVKKSFILSGFLLLSTLFTSHDNIFWGIYEGARPLDLKLILALFILLLSGFSILIKLGFLIIKKDAEIIKDQNEIIKKISYANSGFQTYANLAEEKSITAERMRITREIHDSVGYTMTNLLMMIEASTDLVGVDNEKLDRLLSQTLEIIKTGHKDMRHSLRVLRNTKVRESNTIENIGTITKVFEDSTGVQVRVEFGNLPWELNDEVDNIIFRFLQEGMTNSLTHGDARNIDIHFRVTDDIIYINIIDDGNGCIDVKEGIGLKGMEERLSEVTGHLYYSNTYSGFSVKVEIPWKRDG